MRRKEIGVMIDWRGATLERITRVAREADELGYGYFWVPEAWGLEAFATVACTLGNTKRIRVGTGILNVFSRSAALIGMGCITLHELGPNRFMLGLGTSGKALVEDWHGIKFERPLDRLKDYVKIVRAVTNGETVNYEGRTVSLSRFRIFSKSIFNPEIYLGVMGDKSLALSGEIADGAILTMYPKSKLKHAIGLLGGNGKKMRKIFAYYPTAVSNDPSASFRVSKYISFYIASMGKYYAKHLESSGYPEEVRRIQSAHSAGDREGMIKQVSEKMLDDLSFVGSKEKIRRSIDSLEPNVVPIIGLDISTERETEVSLASLREVASEFF